MHNIASPCPSFTPSARPVCRGCSPSASPLRPLAGCLPSRPAAGAGAPPARLPSAVASGCFSPSSVTSFLSFPSESVLYCSDEKEVIP
nr:MAG TPA: hypothetical protein [Caudoviricetes sp.]